VRQCAARRATGVIAGMPRVLLFDIDGTLVLTGGAGGRAMTRAFDELFHVPDAFRGVDMPGRTDPLILADAAARAGVPLDAARRLAFRERYCAYLTGEVAIGGPRKGVMPGVRALLDTLAGRDDVLLALLTGNYEPAARIKLEHFDLWRYFRCGAYGDEAPDRNGLVPVALQRVAALGVPEPVPSEVLVIGDTPSDVACARAAGARAIGVATGSHDVAALSACGAEVALADLGDLPAFLQLLEE